jgi:hypothetical protein
VLLYGHTELFGYLASELILRAIYGLEMTSLIGGLVLSRAFLIFRFVTLKWIQFLDPRHHISQKLEPLERLPLFPVCYF